MSDSFVCLECGGFPPSEGRCKACGKRGSHFDEAPSSTWVAAFLNEDEGFLALHTNKCRDELFKGICEQYVKPLWLECHCDGYYSFDCGCAYRTEEAWNKLGEGGWEDAFTEFTGIFPFRVVLQEIKP